LGCRKIVVKNLKISPKSGIVEAKNPNLEKIEDKIKIVIIYNVFCRMFAAVCQKFATFCPVYWVMI